MSKASTRVNPLLGWISASGFDAVGRISLQVLATVFFARWLSPEIFGQASLTIVLVGVLAIFATAPFEEALTQRKIVRRPHFASTLSAVLLVALVSSTFTFGLWRFGGLEGDAEIIAGLVAFYSLTIFSEGPTTIYTALARRQKAFHRVAWSNLLGFFGGTLVGLALAFQGAGVWSILGLQMTARALTLMILVAASPVWIRPGFSLRHLRELSGFAGWVFGSRVIKNITDAAFQGLVSRWFGLTGLGYLNMALRIVEPVRGATLSIGHNISMSFFVRLQNTPYKLRDSIEQAVTGSALILFPVFIGLAAAGPSIIEVIAGPGWGPSAVLVVFLALGCALTSATNFHHTGIIAKGRAELGFAASVVALLTMAVSLWLLAGFGLFSAGVARFLAFASDAIFAVMAARSVLELGARSSARLISPLLASTSLMGIAVFGLGKADIFAETPLLRLAVQIAAGVLLYAALLALFHRRRFWETVAELRAQPPAGESRAAD